MALFNCTSTNGHCLHRSSAVILTNPGNYPDSKRNSPHLRPLIRNFTSGLRFEPRTSRRSTFCHVCINVPQSFVIGLVQAEVFSLLCRNLAALRSWPHGLDFDLEGKSKSQRNLIKERRGLTSWYSPFLSLLVLAGFDKRGRLVPIKALPTHDALGPVEHAVELFKMSSAPSSADLLSVGGVRTSGENIRAQNGTLEENLVICSSILANNFFIPFCSYGCERYC